MDSFKKSSVISSQLKGEMWDDQCSETSFTIKKLPTAEIEPRPSFSRPAVNPLSYRIQHRYLASPIFGWGFRPYDLCYGGTLTPSSLIHWLVFENVLGELVCMCGGVGRGGGLSDFVGLRYIVVKHILKRNKSFYTWMNECLQYATIFFTNTCTLVHVNIRKKNRD